MTDQKKPATNQQTQPSPAWAKPKAVSAAYLHKAVMLPGGQTEQTLTQDKLPGIKMAWARSEGLIVEHKNRKALIPDTNVAIVYIDEPAES